MSSRPGDGLMGITIPTGGPDDLSRVPVLQRQLPRSLHPIPGRVRWGDLTLLPMSQMPAADQVDCDLPAGSENLILHAALKIGDEMLMGRTTPAATVG